MRWPWQARKQTTAQREQAEARAEQVHEEVVRPLREMRQKDRLTSAIIADIRAQLGKDAGRNWGEGK